MPDARDRINRGPSNLRFDRDGRPIRATCEPEGFAIFRRGRIPGGDFNLAVEAQRDFCEANELPCYAPTNGRCPNCQRNIYLDGYDLRHAGRNLITGCPHCHYSFVE